RIGLNRSPLGTIWLAYRPSPTSATLDSIQSGCLMYQAPPGMKTVPEPAATTASIAAWIAGAQSDDERVLAPRSRMSKTLNPCGFLRDGPPMADDMETAPNEFLFQLTLKVG